ncbi:rhodanese-like domain-containing protein [Fulvivirga lutimaris]|uniref:rhodanese-like domain-containing protein n=1 Tax=Fulvivirga lutimaris TaxID=1819566 RepID=UPI001FE80786|nr:rhodanese-like domain-containing protein [Fulvivirga lutimaris]
MGQKTFDEKITSLLNNTVPVIKEEELSKRLQSEHINLLDARSKEEFEVSHIDGAKFIDYDSFDKEMLKGLSIDDTVVVYCSVGYRSEKIGEKLQKLGYKNVLNLYGGIFDWKNKGHEVVDTKGIQTDSVHTYNKSWSQWLYKGVKVYD